MTRGRSAMRIVSDGEESSGVPRSRSKKRENVPANAEVTQGVDESDNLCDIYAENCRKVGVPVDPSVYISLQTKWHVLKPSSRFAEGDALPLIGVLERAKHIQKLNLEGTAMTDIRYRAAGNGNSNARALVSILQKNDQISELNLRATGLDDDGLKEVCSAIKGNNSLTHLNLAHNNFTESGTKELEDALANNRTLKSLDLSNNALGFESIQRLECSCKASGLVLEKSGNFVFEEILNSVSHGVAFILSIVGGVVLMNAVVEAGHPTDYHYWACMIYSFALIYLFLASTCYHGAFMMKARHRDVLQVLDNIGIYMVIAGTYTPLLLVGLHNSAQGHKLLIFEWLCGAVCSCFAIYADLNDTTNGNIKLGSMLMMGGACLLIWFEIMESLSRDYVILLLLGGAGYIAGIPFFILSEHYPIYHTIWHLFVVFAATVHWFATYWYVINIDIELGAKLDAWVEQATIDVNNPVAYMNRVVQEKRL